MSEVAEIDTIRPAPVASLSRTALAQRIAEHRSAQQRLAELRAAVAKATAEIADLQRERDALGDPEQELADWRASLEHARLSNTGAAIEPPRRAEIRRKQLEEIANKLAALRTAHGKLAEEQKAGEKNVLAAELRRNAAAVQVMQEQAGAIVAEIVKAERTIRSRVTELRALASFSPPAPHGMPRRPFELPKPAVDAIERTDLVTHAGRVDGESEALEDWQSYFAELLNDPAAEW